MALQKEREATMFRDCSSSYFTKGRVTDSSSLIDELLSADIMSSIFQKLNYVDLVRSLAVNSHWNSIGGGPRVSSTPCLMFPSEEDVDGEYDIDVNNNAYNYFLKLGESQVCSLKRIPKEFQESCCVGSSNGWLIFLEDQAIPSLFHPFKHEKIQLPSLLRHLDLRRLKRNPEGDYKVRYHDQLFVDEFTLHTKHELRHLFIKKVVLIREPNSNNENFDVVLFCHDKLLYYRSGESSWNSTLLDTRVSIYEDIIWHDKHLYILKILKDEGTDIEIWGLKDNLLRRKTNNFVPFPYDLPKSWRYRFYLVESCGEILLAIRFIKDNGLLTIRFSRDNGDVRYEQSNVYFFQLSRDNGNVLNEQRNVYFYRTYLFHIYKLDTNQNRWERMESLGDRVLFLGENESASISTQSFPHWESDLIYYTDDYFSKKNINTFRSAGHDFGIYNLKDKSVKPMCEFYKTPKILPLPTPCWIVPPAERSLAMIV